jgi:hypothetical protein
MIEPIEDMVHIMERGRGGRDMRERRKRRKRRKKEERRWGKSCMRNSHRKIWHNRS